MDETDSGAADARGAGVPELERVIDSSRAEIRATLSPAQRATYDSQRIRLRPEPRRPTQEDDHD